MGMCIVSKEHRVNQKISDVEISNWDYKDLLFEDCVVSNCVHRFSEIDKAKLVDTDISVLTMSGVCIKHLSLHSRKNRRTSISGLNLNKISIEKTSPVHGIEFSNSLFDTVRIYEGLINKSVFTKVAFINCVFHKVRFLETMFKQCSFSGCSFRECSFDNYLLGQGRSFFLCDFNPDHPLGHLAIRKDFMYNSNYFSMVTKENKFANCTSPKKAPLFASDCSGIHNVFLVNGNEAVNIHGDKIPAGEHFRAKRDTVKIFVPHGPAAPARKKEFWERDTNKNMAYAFTSSGVK